jgi:hypothetical protein
MSARPPGSRLTGRPSDHEPQFRRRDVDGDVAEVGRSPRLRHLRPVRPPFQAPQKSKRGAGDDATHTRPVHLQPIREFLQSDGRGGEVRQIREQIAAGDDDDFVFYAVTDHASDVIRGLSPDR